MMENSLQTHDKPEGNGNEFDLHGEPESPRLEHERHEGNLEQEHKDLEAILEKIVDESVEGIIGSFEYYYQEAWYIDASWSKSEEAQNVISEIKDSINMTARTIAERQAVPIMGDFWEHWCNDNGVFEVDIKEWTEVSGGLGTTGDKVARIRSDIRGERIQMARAKRRLKKRNFLMRSLKRLNPDEQKKEDETNSAKVLGGMAREWMSEETKFLESKAISAEKEADILKEKLAEAGGDFDLDYPNKVGFEQIDSEGDVVSYRKFEELAKDYLSECEDRSDLPRSLVEDLGAYWRKKSLAESKRSRIEQWDRLSPEELSRKYYAAAIKWLKQGVVSARSDIKGYQREINRLSPIAKTYPIIYKEQLLENSQILKEEIKNQARFQCEQALRDFAFGKIGKMETSWGEGDEYSFRYDFVSRDGTRKTGSFRDNVFAGDNIEYEEIEYFVDALRSSLGDTVNQIDDNVLFLTDKDSLLTDVKAPDEIRDKKGARQFQYFYQLQVDLEREFLDRGNLRYLDQTEGNIGPLIEKVKEMQIFKDIVESKASRETFYCVMDDGRDIRVSGHPAFSSVADEYVWIPFCNNDEELLDKLKDAADKLRDMG